MNKAIREVAGSALEHDLAEAIKRFMAVTGSPVDDLRITVYPDGHIDVQVYLRDTEGAQV